MKKIVLLAVVFLTFNNFLNAQTTEQITENFKRLLVESDTDFKSIQGNFVESDDANKLDFYTCSTTLGSTYEKIIVNSVDHTVYFAAAFDYASTNELIKATEILPGILDVINAMVKSGKYTGRDYTNSKNEEITEVKDLQGNYIIEIATGAENKFLVITVYGKSWGTK